MAYWCFLVFEKRNAVHSRDSNLNEKWNSLGSFIGSVNHCSWPTIACIWWVMATLYSLIVNPFVLSFFCIKAMHNFALNACGSHLRTI